VGEGNIVSRVIHSFAPAPPRPFTSSPHTHSLHVPQAEAVPLSLGHDGIWYVPATPELDTSFTRPSRHSPFQPPRLAPFIEQRYAPTGRLQASPLTPGLMLDIYV
jgi:hypothetical protein